MFKTFLTATSAAALLCLSPVALSAAAAKTGKPIATADELATRPAIPQVTVSPDGTKIAYRVAQSKKGDYAIEVREIANMAKKPVRLGSAKMDITGFSWISDDQILVNFRQQTGRQVKKQNRGTFQGQTAIMNADGSGRPVTLYPDLEVISEMVSDPGSVLVRTRRGQRGRNVDNYVMNVETGALRKHSNNGTKQVFRDKDGNPFLAVEDRPDRGGTTYYIGTGGDDWKEILTVPDTDFSAKVFPLGLHPAKDGVLLAASNISPTGAKTEFADVYEIDRTTGQMTRLWGKPGQDITSAVYDPSSAEQGRVAGFRYYDAQGRPQTQWLSRKVKTMYDNVEGALPGHDISITSANRDNTVYTVVARKNAGVPTHYVVAGSDVIPVGPARALKPNQLSDKRYVEYPSKDGTVKVPAYVTVPKTGNAPYPAIVMPHGGPFVEWRPTGFDEWTQFLASQGYVVIDPLFRGTEGLGRSFLEGGYANWGEEMNDDMDAAIPYLAAQGLIDPDKVAMFGWSHGGYASVAAAMRSPQMYRCTIPGAAVTDLGQQNSGFADDRDSRRFLQATYKGLDPIKNVEKISVPMLVIHGELDQRVMKEQADVLLKEMDKQGKPYRKLYLPKADHFSNTLTYDDRLAMYNEISDFLKNECGM